MRTLELHQNPLAPAQRARFDANLFTGFQVRPRLARHPRSDHGLNSFDLGLFDGNWLPAVAHHLNHAGCFQNRQALLRIKSAEKILRKQWRFRFLKPIGPTRAPLIQRKEIFTTHALKICRDPGFVVRARMQGKPRQTAATGPRTVYISFRVSAQRRMTLPSPSYRHSSHTATLFLTPVVVHSGCHNSTASIFRN